MSTFNMLLSVCASSQDFDGNYFIFVKSRLIHFCLLILVFHILFVGAFQVMLLLKEAGLKPDCKLYTTLISTCAKSRKVDAMFEVW